MQLLEAQAVAPGMLLDQGEVISNHVCTQYTFVLIACRDELGKINCIKEEKHTHIRVHNLEEYRNKQHRKQYQAELERRDRLTKFDN